MTLLFNFTVYHNYCLYYFTLSQKQTLIVNFTNSALADLHLPQLCIFKYQTKKENRPDETKDGLESIRLLLPSD